MDTWATSSLTPEIAGHWDDDPDLFARVYPMDIRPQGSDIIRTWLFATVVRSHYEHSKLPWRSATINGWILDPDRKKMSKSKGNVVTPAPLLEEYGSEAVRYWACNGRPGVDTAVDLGVIKIGRRLGIKILNASRFALGFSEDVDPANITEPIDRSMLAGLFSVVGQATEAFERFDYARALEITEHSFWSWTDDYLELVKTRAYGEGPEAASAHATLQMGLAVYLRLFAPFLPFVTEEAWSWYQVGSIHRASWPSADEFDGLTADTAILEITSQVLSSVRRTKSDAKVSMRAEVESISVSAGLESIEFLKEAESDLMAASRAATITYSEGEFSVEVLVDEASSSSTSRS
jgi:valyl-tRNA synthetase